MDEQYEEQDELIETESDDTSADIEQEEESLEEPAGNPALTELYDVLPKSLHGLVQPVLDKWQSGIDQQFEKFSPYRKIAEAGIDVEVIEASMELARQVASNPKAVYDELAERYGWKEAQQIVKEAVETAEAADPDFDPFESEEDPTATELKALKAELDALKADREDQATREMEAAYNYEIETSIDLLKEQHGEFDEEAVVRRAMILADDYPDAELAQLLGAAYEQYSTELDRMRAQVKRAPRVAGGTGNAIPAPAPRKLETREDRIAAIEAIVKQSLGS